DAFRSRIISILQKAHINLPNIPISTDEGKVRPALAEDEEYDEQENDNNSPNSAEQTPPDDQDDTNQDDTEQDVTPDDQPSPDDTKGDMVIEYATPEDNTTEEDTPDTDYQPQKAESEFEIIQKTDKDDEASPDVLAHGIETEYDPREDLSNYEFPSFDLLKDYGKQNIEESQEKLFENKDKIVQTLENFQIKITSIKATVGPTVTLYEIVPAPGIRISKIKNLEDDIAMSLAALGIRIMAPIPGLGTIGIEVPNSKPQIVSMMSVIKSSSFQESQAEIPIAIGKTISNETFVFDLAKTPHLLVAGATGQGKSVGLNAIITSILYRKHPSEIKFVLVDPKMVEFSVYKSLDKHYLAKMESGDEAVITDFDKVKSTLLSINVEMDNRYRLLEKASVRNIKEYNEKFIARRLNPNDDHRFLPYLVVIIDEFADLIMTAGKEVETPIARIAQKARAVGIHMILATQRPSTNIITGVIKANFPSRIAFKVASGIDSRTILDSTGAQSLIGRGDMLVLLTGKMTPTRVQCAFVDTPEVERINNFISSQQGYIGPYELPDVTVQSDGSFSEANDGGDPGKFDSKIREIALMVVESQIGSTSNIQRRFEVGYNRAGKIMDQLERMGIVSPADGSKPRAVYVQTEAELENILQRFGV
ncbi:MAG: DNA translocase FtsK, partial [Bacteroidales bacterium]|nr:DNA translocase FtsK [Bacteroidales bacterium]